MMKHPGPMIVRDDYSYGDGEDRYRQVYNPAWPSGRAGILMQASHGCPKATGKP